MKSNTTLQNSYGVDTKSTSAANLAYGVERMNDYIRKLLAIADWPFLHRLRTATTIASTSFVELPYDIDQVESVFVAVGTTRHTPRPAPSRKFWDELHYSDQTSDTPEYWFVYNGQLGLWPRPATSGNTISINCKVRVTDLQLADLTSQTVSIANADETVTGSGTSWFRGIAGFWLKIAPNTSSATTSGDGEWYEIASVTSTTALELAKEYNGGTVASGTATIGQMPLLPEAFHDLPEMYAAYRYWQKEIDPRADGFRAMLDDGQARLFQAYSLSDLSMVIDDGDEHEPTNPNLVISL